MTKSPQTRMKKGGKNVMTSAHRKARYSFYKAHTYLENKLKHILRSNRIADARAWARIHAAENVLAKLIE